MDLATFTKWPIVKFLEERGWLYFPPMAYDDYLIFTHSKRQLVLDVYSDKVVFLQPGKPTKTHAGLSGHPVRTLRVLEEHGHAITMKLLEGRTR
jgi:hypothetical protein